jgi:hypothetical protein
MKLDPGNQKRGQETRGTLPAPNRIGRIFLWVAGHQPSGVAALPGQASPKCRFGHQPVLFRHNPADKLMQKIHTLTDN